jgi:hypothetical protein
MRPPGVIRLTGLMTTDDRPPPPEPPRRTSTWLWVVFLGGVLTLVLLAVLPLVTTAVAIGLWGAGSSGSNK